MRFQVIHTTRYLYDRPVVLEPHTLRLRPRSDPFQQLHYFSASFKPQPAGVSDSIDLDGNAITIAWFDGFSDGLRITSRCTVDTLCTNPFNFIVTEPTALRLPARYPAALQPQLAAYLQIDPQSGTVERFARDVLSDAGGETIRFLPLLCQRIQETCTSDIREDGMPHPAAVTLERRAGACRDTAVLFMEACRRVGLAARFVSGYHEAKPAIGPRQLHAWAEVYLPGGGWRGFDPSSGLAVADRHVALAAGACPSGAAAVTGTIRGTGACGSLYAEVQLEAENPDAPSQSQSMISAGL